MPTRKKDYVATLVKNGASDKEICAAIAARIRRKITPAYIQRAEADWRRYLKQPMVPLEQIIAELEQIHQQHLEKSKKKPKKNGHVRSRRRK